MIIKQKKDVYKTPKNYEIMLGIINDKSMLSLKM